MEALRTATLTKVREGLLAAMLDAKLALAFEDCENRPTLEQARKVTLEIKIKPTGESPLEMADIEFAVKLSKPADGFSRQLKAKSKNKAFLFEPDTDNTTFQEGQTKFED